MDSDDPKHKRLLSLCASISFHGSSMEKISIRTSFRDGELKVFVVVRYGERPLYVTWNIDEFHEMAQSLFAHLEAALENCTTITELDLDLILLPYFYDRDEGHIYSNMDDTATVSCDEIPKTNDVTKSSTETCWKLRPKFNKLLFSNPSLRKLHLRIPRYEDEKIYLYMRVTRKEWSKLENDFFEKLQHSVARTSTANPVAMDSHVVTKTNNGTTDSTIPDELEFQLPDRLYHSDPPATDIPLLLTKVLASCQVNKLNITNATHEELNVLATEGLRHNSNIKHIELKGNICDPHHDIHPFCNVLANHPTITAIEWIGYVDLEERAQTMLCLKNGCIYRVNVTFEPQDIKCLIPRTIMPATPPTTNTTTTTLTMTA